MTVSDTRRRAILWAIPMLLAGWTLAMLLLTLMPMAEVRGELPFIVTKLGHSVLFFGWTVLAGLYLMVFRRKWTIGLLPLFVAATLFGAGIEVAQQLLPFNRTGRVLDVIMNAIGAAGGCWALARFRASRPGATGAPGAANATANRE